MLLRSQHVSLRWGSLNQHTFDSVTSIKHSFLWWYHQCSGHQHRSYKALHVPSKATTYTSLYLHPALSFSESTIPILISQSLFPWKYVHTIICRCSGSPSMYTAANMGSVCGIQHVSWSDTCEASSPLGNDHIQSDTHIWQGTPCVPHPHTHACLKS